MASSKDYKDYIMDNLSIIDNIMCRSMMGEYLLYYNNILFGGIYDDRLLVKIVDSNKKYNMEEAIPYVGAKAMYLVNDVDDREILKDIVIDTCKGLKGWQNNK
ncbi:MAG: TfoX/Sxy family protein [Bacilli bacterium]|nr:TfoX/Sxy family protein [Bacilli bacterium]MBR3162021.1 TfoX/Sxy family protein [Bacilli bacterium]